YIFIIVNIYHFIVNNYFLYLYSFDLIPSAMSTDYTLCTQGCSKYLPACERHVRGRQFVRYYKNILSKCSLHILSLRHARSCFHQSYLIFYFGKFTCTSIVMKFHTVQKQKNWDTRFSWTFYVQGYLFFYSIQYELILLPQLLLYTYLYTVIVHYILCMRLLLLLYICGFIGKMYYVRSTSEASLELAQTAFTELTQSLAHRASSTRTRCFTNDLPLRSRVDAVSHRHRDRITRTCLPAPRAIPLRSFAAAAAAARHAFRAPTRRKSSSTVPYCRTPAMVNQKRLTAPWLLFLLLTACRAAITMYAATRNCIYLHVSNAAASWRAQDVRLITENAARGGHQRQRILLG
ncbi:unnamed protein product, partial [Trichogramma brassicae]